jgi:putative heme-binding domain-containing protein
VYGKVNNVIDDHPRTGELMPVMTHLGSAAPTGLACYESPAFGPDFRGNLFATMFNLHKITRHVLTAQGASFASRDEDFLVSDNLDFHPTDVLEDADGSLIVVDTGGWYKLCCPTSQLWKPDVLGGIYRVRRSGAERTADARGLALAWDKSSPEELAKLLTEERPAVRRRAIGELARRGAAAVPAIERAVRQSRSALARCQAVWALSRIDSAGARAVVRTALGDDDEVVRQAALHVVSVWRDRDAAPRLIELLADAKSPANRRAAAEALGRLGHPAAVPALLSVAGEELDRPLEHSVTFALIEIANRAETSRGLDSSNSRTRRAALMAVDQMDGGGLDPESVAELLSSPDRQMRETAAFIVGRHPNWASALLPFLERRMAGDEPSADDAGLLEQLLARFANDAKVQALLATRLSSASTRPAMRRILLQTMNRGGLRAVPPGWVAPLVSVLKSDAALAPLAVSAVRSMARVPEGADELAAALLAAAGNERLPAGVRLEALGTVPGGLTQVSPQLLQFMRSNLSPEAQVSVRLAAADAISKARLDDRQLVLLADTVRSAGPLEIERVVAPYARGAGDDVGRALVAALAECKALTTLRAETLQGIFKNYRPTVQNEAKTLYDLLAAGTLKQKAKLEEILVLLPMGDIRRGQAVFNSQKAACAACHAIGYLGGNIGPDLTKIGATRTERDLLEAIVFPSASFVRSYEPVVVTTKAGKIHAGTIRLDSPDEVTLALNAKESVRIARDEIEEMTAGTVSIMPAGLDQQLSPQDLVDLIAFLRAGK